MVCENCDFEIVHYDCAGFSQIPDEQWFCPRCSREMNRQEEQDRERRKAFLESGGKLETKKDRPKRLKSKRKRFQLYEGDSGQESDISDSLLPHLEKRRSSRISERRSRRTTGVIDDEDESMEDEEEKKEE